MNESTMCIFAVIGQDARQQAAAAWLEKQGCVVVPASGLHKAQYALLPMPLSSHREAFAQLLQQAVPGLVAFAGKVSDEARAAAREANLELYDYLDREELALLNAIPTAEGCIALLLQNRTRTLWHSPVLVLGYGRCAQALAQRLNGLGAYVTVAVRSSAQRALAQSQGCRVLELSQLEPALHSFDTVVNTIPAQVLRAAQLDQMATGTLVVDLASLPGGVDLEAARQRGIHAIRALSLPARCAPDTAGEFVARTVLAILQERGE